MKNFAKLFWILTVLLVLPLAVFAAPVGKITYIEGNVDITAVDKVRTATLGEPVSAGDVLRSKSKAKAEVTFLDGNILRLAEGTRVRITDYQTGERKTSILDLFRGKTQNIISGLAKNARYEVHTPTAVAGVRGTNFISFFQNGVSGFVPKEGTIYGYNRNMPQEIRTVTPGQAIMVLGANQPAVIQPATSIEVDKHVSDTAPGGEKGDKDKDKKDKGGPAGFEGGMSQLLSPLEPPKEINLTQTNLQVTMTRDDWTFDVRGLGDVKLISKTYFPLTYADPPVGSTAAGTLLGVVDSKTYVGAIDMTLQYTKPSESAFYNVPQLEVGNVIGQMQDGSGFTGTMASIPGSWMGAMSGIYAGGTGVGMYLGYLEGTYNPDNGKLVAGGGLARTPTLGPPPTAFGIVSPYTFEFLGLDAPGVASVSVAETPGYPSYVSSGIVSADYFSGNVDIGAYAGASQSYLSSSLLSAWAVTRINDSGEFSYNTSSPKTWTAKYGYSGYNSYALAPYFIVGDVTGYESGAGTETDPTRLRLSGRNLLYITPGYNNFDPKQFTSDLEGGKFAYGVPSSMGYFNFELWNGGAYGYGGGAGVLELAPTAFGGYWGYDSSSLTCLYYNYMGNSLRVADEWGLIGAWTAPWNAPANIKIAGAYQMDASAYGYRNAPGFLWSSPVSSSYNGDNPFNVSDATTKFFGYTAGRIGRYASTGSDAWERNAKGTLAAIYVNEGQAGLLTTFAPGSAVGGLTGGFFPDETGYGGFWRLDGTLTATSLSTPDTTKEINRMTASSNFQAKYSTASSSITGSGNVSAYYLNAQVGASRYDLPWGIYILDLSSSSAGFSAGADAGTTTLSGKNVKIGGGSSSGVLGYWLGDLTNTVWTSTQSGSGEIGGHLSGQYLSLTQYGTFGGPFYGLYDEDGAGYGGGGWIGKSVGAYQGESLAFSSMIEGYRYAALPGDGALTLQQQDSFSGIMGGLSTNLWTNKTSPIKFLGVLGADIYMESFPISPFLSASEIGSYIPQTSAFTGAYQGFLGVAADSANTLSGGIMALYQDGSGGYGGYGGHGGILYSSDIAGAYNSETGFWKAQGNLAVYEMTDYISSSTITRRKFTKSYAAGEVPVDVILGGTVDLRQSMAVIQNFSDEPWGIWNNISVGTYTGGTPQRWISKEDYFTLPTQAWTGGYGGQYLNFNLGAPVNGVSSGTVAGAQARWGETSADQPTPQSYTVVVGGVVKGIFDPATPMTGTIISQGGAMETSAFMAKQAGMDDAAKANFERAMKIPTFDVGTTSLRGNDGLATPNLYVNMDGIKFFRFQTEADPRIWATNNVYGSYTSDPSMGTKVQLTSSGNLTGLKQTFEVKQWDTSNNNWGAAVYRSTATGSTDTGGTLTRSTTDAARAGTVYLPSGAAATIPITEMRGGAAGIIQPMVAGTQGPKSFVGTAAGTVR